MALLVPNVGEERMLRLITHTTTAASTNGNLMLRLYKTDVTPTSTQTLVDYTEATFTGYAATECTSGSWTITAGAPSDATQSSATTFTCGAATSESIYGYFLTQQDSSVLMWAEKFSDGPYVLTNDGDKIILTAAVTLSTT